jgi:predicted DNA-binding transcriptional regulator AlpA
VIPRAEDRPTVSVREAAPLLGFSDATLYRAIAEGRAPVETIKCGARVVVVTASLRAVLHLDDTSNGNGQGTAVAVPDDGRAREPD